MGQHAQAAPQEMQHIALLRAVASSASNRAPAEVDPMSAHLQEGPGAPVLVCCQSVHVGLRHTLGHLLLVLQTYAASCNMMQLECADNSSQQIASKQSGWYAQPAKRGQAHHVRPAALAACR